MNRLLPAAFAALLWLGGCTSPVKKETAATEKRYEMRGEVIRVEPAAQIAHIKHEKIGDWMDAMTMDFPVKPKSELDKIAPGDQITGTVVVKDMDYYLTDIKVIKKAGH
jgi:Cu/Ag efflux protein CusF